MLTPLDFASALVHSVFATKEFNMYNVVRIIDNVIVIADIADEVQAGNMALGYNIIHGEIVTVREA